MTHQTKVCSRCKTEQPLTNYWVRKKGVHAGRIYPECVECAKAIMRLKATGWSAREFEDAYIKQDGKCAICKCVFGTSRYTKPNADHCHKGKKPRGLLCQQCNVGLGMFKDSVHRLRFAIEYIEKHKSEEIVCSTEQSVAPE